MSVTSLVSTAGAVVEYVLYDAYGKASLYQSNWTTTQASTVYNNEVLYSGYRLNPESGMYQVRRREYHPLLGKWVQRDPMGYHDGANLYEYVSSNAPNRSDPMGLYAQAGWGNPAGYGVNTYVHGQGWGKINVVSSIDGGSFAGTIVDGPPALMASSPNAWHAPANALMSQQFGGAGGLAALMGLINIPNGGCIIGSYYLRFFRDFRGSL